MFIEMDRAASTPALNGSGDNRRKKLKGTAWSDRQNTAKCSNCKSKQSNYWTQVSAISEELGMTSFANDADDVRIRTNTTNGSTNEDVNLLCIQCAPALKESKVDGGTALKKASMVLNRCESPAHSDCSSVSSSTNSFGGTRTKRKHSSARPERSRSAIEKMESAKRASTRQFTKQTTSSSIYTCGGVTKVRGPISRRTSIFKSVAPAKAPKSRATITTCEALTHLTRYFRVGDVVSVQDEQDGQLYYAQIRGLASDQFCKKYAALIWLIPTPSAPSDGSFQAESFVRGPKDETLYEMECLDFVCNRPSEYNSSVDRTSTNLRLIL